MCYPRLKVAVHKLDATVSNRMRTALLAARRRTHSSRDQGQWDHLPLPPDTSATHIHPTIITCKMNFRIQQSNTAICNITAQKRRDNLTHRISCTCTSSQRTKCVTYTYTSPARELPGFRHDPVLLCCSD